MAGQRVLIFAYHFPPDPSAGSTRPFHFAKYLSRLGHSVTVFTAARQRIEASFEVHCIEDPFVPKRRLEPAWQLERGFRKLFWPGGTGIRWALHAVRAARQHLSGCRGARSVILSTFPPLGAHLAGWRLNQVTGLAWVADFRDPMTFTPGVWEHLRLEHRWAARRLEHCFVRRASAIVAATEALAEQFRRRHPEAAGKTHSIWNGFDPEDRLRPLPLPPRRYRLFSHVGEIYSGRSATGLLESIGRLVESGRLDARRHRILLAGPMEPAMLPSVPFLQQAARQGWLELRPEPVAKQEALRIAQTSDGLLLIQPQSMIQVPAKLFEYLQIGRPVLAYVPPGSQTEVVLAKSGVPYVCAYAGISPAEFDDRVADYFALPGESAEPAPSFNQEFSAERRARRMEEILSSL